MFPPYSLLGEALGSSLVLMQIQALLSIALWNFKRALSNGLNSSSRGMNV